MFTVTWIRSLEEEAASEPGKSMSESTHNSGKRVKPQALEIAWLGLRARPGIDWLSLTRDLIPAKIAAARISAMAKTTDDIRSFFLLLWLLFSGCADVETWFRIGAVVVEVVTEPVAPDGPSLSYPILFLV